jgi:poly-beta-1,6-N-acetyl-D-glucosamine synthase
MILWALIYLFVAALLSLGNLRLLTRNSGSAVLRTPWSVVLAIRNEKHNLGGFLKPFAMAENQPERIVIIDDHSEDGGFEAWKTESQNGDSFWSSESANAFFSRVQHFPALESGKKAAIRQGFKRCDRGIVLFSDADARWDVQSLQSLLTEGAPESVRMVCATVSQRIFAPGFFARIVEADYRAMMMVASGAAGMGYPFLCSGAALAIRKDDQLMELPEQGPGDSGDDVFLLHRIQNRFGRHSVSWSLQPVIAEEHGTVSALFSQRLRWAGKSVNYRNFTAVFLSLYLPVMHLAGVFLLLKGHWPVLLFKLLADILIWGRRPDAASVMLSCLYFVYLPLMPVAAVFMPTEWKQRKVQH